MDEDVDLDRLKLLQAVDVRLGGGGQEAAEGEDDVVAVGVELARGRGGLVEVEQRLERVAGDPQGLIEVPRSGSRKS